MQIVDAEELRSESPLPLVPKMEVGATEPLYTFEIRESDAAFTVRRKESSLPLYVPNVYGEFLSLIFYVEVLRKIVAVETFFYCCFAFSY